MNLNEDIKEKIFRAHFVKNIPPNDYKVIYNNIFELLQYRAHLHEKDIYITFYPDEGDKIQLSYKDFYNKVIQTANLLRKNNIGVEDRIAAVSHNHINTVIQYFAAWCTGATVVPINVNEEPERIKYILSSSGTKLAFVHNDYLEKILSYKNKLPELKKIFVHSKLPSPLRRGAGGEVMESSGGEVMESSGGEVMESSFNKDTESNSLENEIEIYEDEIAKEPLSFDVSENVTLETEALIVYTSGTTGLPKGVVLTQYNLMIDADGISKWHKLEKGQVMMCVLPIHHVNGTIVTLLTPMYYGGSVVLNQKFHTHKFFQRLANEQVQVVSVVPTLLQFLCHDFETGEDKDFYYVFEEKIAAAFRHIICGAGPLTCELALKFEKMFDMKIMHGYGLSETTCYSCFLPVDISGDEHTSWLGEHGFPSIGVEIEPNEMDIHNDKGESLYEGERGEIVIRGHNVMKYYDENPEANEKTFEFGWFRSGDEGFYKLDERGRKYFFITGRLKELIIRGGVNIAPLEIDEVLMSLPEVKAGIAVGFDNDWYGEEVGALVILRENLLPGAVEGLNGDKIKQDIINKCREKLPFYKCPKVIVFSDTIPVTSTGKYQRNKVKHLFEEWKKVQFK
ncbi:MAG: long-chain fatty acid--CoA ligase [Ignavibacteriae bacterium]|nr:MAG: long-chain fatty acid--CoA ligase [Ignavibacteriota bacterium]